MLPRVTRETVHLTVTSPPYNIGKEYETPRDVGDYIDWCASLDPRVTQNGNAGGGALAQLGIPQPAGASPRDPDPVLALESRSVPPGSGGRVALRSGSRSKASVLSRNEKFLWYVRDPESYYFDLDAVRDPNIKYPNQFKNGRRKVNLLGKNPTDVWSFPKVTSGKNRSSKERTAHPAQFPFLAVIERIVKACCPPGGLVLDPFMGSGTVAEAALALGRPVVGIEVEPQYIEIAAARIERAARELRASGFTVAPQRLELVKLHKSAGIRLRANAACWPVAAACGIRFV